MIINRVKNSYRARVILLITALIVGSIITFLVITAPQEGPAFVLRSMPAPNFGVVVNPKLEAVEVEPGSAAEQAGLKPGDKFEEIGGQKVTTPAEAVEKGREVILKEKEVEVLVSRQGQKVILRIKPKAPAPRPGPTATPVPQTHGYF